MLVIAIDTSSFVEILLVVSHHTADTSTVLQAVSLLQAPQDLLVPVTYPPHLPSNAGPSLVLASPRVCCKQQGNIPPCRHLTCVLFPCLYWTAGLGVGIPGGELRSGGRKTGSKVDLAGDTARHLLRYALPRMVVKVLCLLVLQASPANSHSLYSHI